MKKKLYNAMVLPHLDYCSVVWQECSKKLQQQVERIQNYGMRLILSRPPRTPTAELRSTLNWLPLTERRRMIRLMLVHRCVNKLGPEYTRDLFRTNEAAGCKRTRGLRKLHVESVNTEVRRKCFVVRGTQDWNTFSEDIRRVQSTSVFNKCMTKYS